MNDMKSCAPYQCEIYTLLIRRKFPSLNEVIAATKKHWGQYAKIKRDATDAVVMVAAPMRRLHDNKAFDRVAITITWYEKERGRKRDWDNITFAKKFILDGLVKSGWIVDDSPRYIASIKEMVTYDLDYAVVVRMEEA